MEVIRQTQKRYCSSALSFAVVAGFIFYLVGMIPVCKGLVLGTLFSILNFILMGETLPMRIDRTKGRTFFVALGSIFFRYILLAIPIYMAIKNEQFDFFSVIVGIFMVQIMLLGDHVSAIIFSRFKKK
ncbi:MAG: ATP synthase subunit I [Desulfobacterales bacterium]